MHDFQKQCRAVFNLMLCLSRFSSQQYILEQLLDEVFCDIRNNQVLGKCYHPNLRLGITLTSGFFVYSAYHKTLSSNCL